MRVVIFARDLAHGGHSRTVVELAHGLQSAGHRVTVAVPGDVPVDWPIRCHLVRMAGGSPDSLPPADAAVAADAESFDAAFSSGRGRVIRLAGRFDPAYAADVERARRALQDAAVVWTVSESLKTLIQAHFGKMSSVLHPGIDPSVFRPRPEFQQRRPAQKVLMFIAPEGPGLPIRGLATAYAALDLARRILPGLQCHGVCRGGVRPPGDGWVLHGRLTDEQLAGLYNTSDVFVHPAGGERTPISVLEAMACGTPVVCVYGDGVDEIAVSGHNALLAPPGDPERLSRLIVRVLSDYTLRQHLIAGGLETVRNAHWSRLYQEAARALAKAASTWR
ncbi:MAG: glycosyltransferase family 4 protein [Kyrpidia sp.]|nr:glycosyltransferase family 4 protein [Kyrpidia sp.]